jgi:ectoine hydroxylase-related dioxygenase (phytanoyl-CoA dioxygenase family)
LAEAAVAGNMIEMQQRLYSASDGLRLMQQMLVRTDADPAAVAAGRSEPGGWHMDTAFLPRHYASSPQTNVFHVLTALNDVPRGGAALHIVPSAFRQCKAYTEKHMDELEGLRDSDFRTVLRPRLLMEAVQDTSECVEVLLSEGDSCVFDLMSTHSAASNCIGGYSRYVLFQTFFDLSASYALLPARGASALPKKFPSEFRDALPSHLHYLLDWQYPLDGGEVKGKFWGLSREDLEKRSAGEVVTERPAAFRRASAQENKPRL